MQPQPDQDIEGGRLCLMYFITNIDTDAMLNWDHRQDVRCGANLVQTRWPCAMHALYHVGMRLNSANLTGI